jgi:hypothetical protein
MCCRADCKGFDSMDVNLAMERKGLDNQLSKEGRCIGMFDAAHAKSDGHVLTPKSNQIHKHLQLRACLFYLIDYIIWIVV